jgi:hypothetical protein
MRWTVTDPGILSCADEPGPTPSEVQFEVGDWHSFTSLTAKTNVPIQHSIETQTEETFHGEHRVDFQSGTALIERSESFSGRTIDRSLTLTTPSRVSIGDFVARFVFRDATSSTAEIAGRHFEHRGQNRYHQFATDTATIRDTEGAFTITTVESDLPKGMELFTYVRDEPPDTWVVHVRVLAIDGTDGMVRLSYLPVTHISVIDWVVRNLPPLSRRLRYICERSSIDSRWLPAQYVEWVTMDSEDRIYLGVHGEYEH